jgi:hypothetical protein
LNVSLPHELAHLILRDFVGLDTEIPLWIEEGVAQWAGSDDRERLVARAVRLERSGLSIPLGKLTRYNVASLDGRSSAAIFYAQAASLVGFLIEEYGGRRFRTLCGHLRDAKTVDEALRFTYPAPLRNLEGLEQAWTEHLRSRR